MLYNFHETLLKKLLTIRVQSIKDTYSTLKLVLIKQFVLK